MRWLIEVELPGGQWFILTTCLTLDAAVAVMRACTSDQTLHPAVIKITRHGDPEPPVLYPHPDPTVPL